MFGAGGKHTNPPVPTLHIALNTCGDLTRAHEAHEDILQLRIHLSVDDFWYEKQTDH